MKELKRITACLAAGLGIIWAGLLLGGCQTDGVYAPFPDATSEAGATTMRLHMFSQPAPRMF